MKWYQTLQNESSDLIVMNYLNLLQNIYLPSMLNISSVITGKVIHVSKLPEGTGWDFPGNSLGLFPNWKTKISSQASRCQICDHIEAFHCEAHDYI